MKPGSLFAIVVSAIFLISCGPSKAELAEQTQAAATATAVSWVATAQHRESVEKDLVELCGSMRDASSIEKGAPPESPGVI